MYRVRTFDSYFWLLSSDLMSELQKYAAMRPICGISTCKCLPCQHIYPVQIFPKQLLLKINFDGDLHLLLNERHYIFYRENFVVFEDLLRKKPQQLVQLVRDVLNSNLTEYNYENINIKMKDGNTISIKTANIQYNICIPCRCALPLIRDKLLIKAEEYVKCSIS